MAKVGEKGIGLVGKLAQGEQEWREHADGEDTGDGMCDEAGSQIAGCRRAVEY